MLTSNDTFLAVLEEVSKTFRMPNVNPLKPGKKIKALDSVSLSIPARKVTCLLGPNGAGKTTLIKILASLITPDGGSIRYSDGAAETIGLVTPNDRSFYWRLTGRQNLEFFGAQYSLRGRLLEERVRESLHDAGAEPFADKPFRMYSAGMKQKLNIARALLGCPELYLLDEPAAHLDPLAREEFWRFIETVLTGKRRATVFLCTHDLEEARRLADHVVVLDQGRVAAEGSQSSLSEVIDDRKEVVIRYEGDFPGNWGGDGLFEIRHRGRNEAAVLFNETAVAQEDIASSFIASGGRLLEFRNQSESLLELLKRKAGNRV